MRKSRTKNRIKIIRMWKLVPILMLMLIPMLSNLLTRHISSRWVQNSHLLGLSKSWTLQILGPTPMKVHFKTTLTIILTIIMEKLWRRSKISSRITKIKINTKINYLINSNSNNNTKMLPRMPTPNNNLYIMSHLCLISLWRLNILLQTKLNYRLIRMRLKSKNNSRLRGRIIKFMGIWKYPNILMIIQTIKLIKGKVVNRLKACKSKLKHQGHRRHGPTLKKLNNPKN